jgi:hypothetical protein
VAALELRHQTYLGVFMFAGRKYSYSLDTGDSDYESPRLKHGVFFHFVLEGLRGKAAAEGEVTWDDLQKYVRRRVSRDVATIVGAGARQTPALNAGELAGEPPVLVALRDVPRDSGPGRVKGARPMLLDCTGEDGLSKEDVRRAQEAWARYLGRKVEETIEVADGVKMTFVLIPPGKFRLGSPNGEEGRSDDETLHEATLTGPFDLGKTEVTQAQYEALTGATPAVSRGPTSPWER